MPSIGAWPKACAKQNCRNDAPPRDPCFGWFYTGMGAAHFYLRHYEECLEWRRKGLQHPIVQWFIRAFIISALSHLDRMEEAAKALAELLEVQPNCTISDVKQKIIITDDAYLDHLVEGLRMAGLPE